MCTGNSVAESDNALLDDMIIILYPSHNILIDLSRNCDKEWWGDARSVWIYLKASLS